MQGQPLPACCGCGSMTPPLPLPSAHKHATLGGQCHATVSPTAVPAVAHPHPQCGMQQRSWLDCSMAPQLLSCPAELHCMHTPPSQDQCFVSNQAHPLPYLAKLWQSHATQLSLSCMHTPSAAGPCHSRNNWRPSAAWLQSASIVGVAVNSPRATEQQQHLITTAISRKLDPDHGCDPRCPSFCCHQLMQHAVNCSPVVHMHRRS
jgi:hypothetical protein